MRLFVAADLPSEIKNYLVSLQGEIGGGEAKIRWIAKNNLHLTLKFFGEISDGELDSIKKALRGTSGKSFEAYLDNIGVFPNENYIRVVWVGLKPEDEVVRLQQIIDGATINFGKSEQEFSAHLTLGRVKFVKNKEKLLKRMKEIEVEKKNFMIKEFILFKSTLTRDGPIYNIVEKYKLK